MGKDTETRILLVEDEAIIALDEQAILERNGYSVTIAHSGTEAVRSFRDDEGICLVLMDIDLGAGMDGTETAERIVSHREVPVVFLTSHTESEYVARVREIAGYGYVLKSAGEFVLIESIHMARKLFRAHKRAQRNERFYNWIASHSRDGIALIENDAVVYASPSFRRLIGLSPEEPKGLDWTAIFDRIHPEDVPRIRNALKAALGRQDPELQYRYRVRSAGDEYRWVEDRVGIRFDGSGTEGSPSFIVNTRDVTEQHQAELRRDLSERRYRSLFEGATNPIAVCDREGVVVDINPAGLFLFGLSHESLVGKQIQAVLPELHEVMLQRIRAALAQGGSLVFTDSLRVPGGEMQRFQTVVQPMPRSEDEEPMVQLMAYQMSPTGDPEGDAETSTP